MVDRKRRNSIVRVVQHLDSLQHDHDHGHATYGKSSSEKAASIFFFFTFNDEIPLRDKHVVYFEYFLHPYSETNFNYAEQTADQYTLQH